LPIQCCSVAYKGKFPALRCFLAKTQWPPVRCRRLEVDREEKFFYCFLRKIQDKGKGHTESADVNMYKIWEDP
jgi:hypothetical protein